MDKMVFPKVNVKAPLTGIWSFPDQLNMLRGRGKYIVIRYHNTIQDDRKKHAAEVQRKGTGKREENEGKVKIKKHLPGIIFLNTHYNHHYHLTSQGYFPVI